MSAAGPDPARRSALDRSVALVAGVGDGIGRSCALAFARAGARVVLAARTDARLRSVAAEIEALGGRALAMPTDITDPTQIERLVDATTETFGRLDAVVNVAALAGDPATIEDLDPDTHRATFEVNVLGPLALARAALPLLRAAGGGSITLTSTLSTRTLLARLGAYTSTKQAMVTAVQTMAREVGRDGRPPSGAQIQGAEPEPRPFVDQVHDPDQRAAPVEPDLVVHARPDEARPPVESPEPHHVLLQLDRIGGRQRAAE